MYRRVIAVGLIGLFFLTFLPVTLTSDVSAINEPEVTLSFETDRVTADNDPGEPGSVTIMGFATYKPGEKNQNIQSISVILNGFCEPIFEYNINPQEFTIDPSDLTTREFSVTISVPRDLEADESYEFRFSGTAKYIPGTQISTIPEESFFVSINPYSKYSVRAHNIRNFYPGKNFVYGVSIYNDGNYDDTFYAEIIDTNIQNHEEWDLTITNPEINIKSQNGERFLISGSIPDDAEKKIYTVTLNITADGKDGTVKTESYEVMLSINVVSKLNRSYYFRISLGVTVVLFVIFLVIAVLLTRRRRKRKLKELEIH